jgi:hypothetical protein
MSFTSDGDAIEAQPSDSKKPAYFTFGRFQPPTRGHRLLAQSLAEEAAAAGADAYIFASSSQDKKRNPLPVGEKVYWMKKVFAGIPVKIINTTVCSGASHPCRTVPNIIRALTEANYAPITMLVGSDRVEEFKSFVPAEVAVRQVGEARNDSAAGLAGMSGTKMREAAIHENLEILKEGTGLSNNNATHLAAHIRNGLKKKGGSRRRKTRRRRY